MRIAALAFVVLAMAACGAEGPPPDVSGDWSYTWAVDEQPPALHGTLTLAQDGATISGVLSVPTEYASPPPQHWDWRIGGDMSSPQIAPGPGVDQPVFQLNCGAQSDVIACTLRQGDHSGTFQASR